MQSPSPVGPDPSLPSPLDPVRNVDATFRNLVVFGTLTAIGSPVIFGSGNLSIGVGAMPPSSTGQNNTAIGSQAAGLLTSGTDNVVIGQQAGALSLTSSYNVAIGVGALGGDQTGQANTAIGWHSMDEANGALTNVAIGAESMICNIHGNQIIDGTFLQPGLPAWRLGAGWSAPGTGRAAKFADGLGTLQPQFPPTNISYIDYGVGATYIVTYTISDLTVGQVTASFGGQSDIPRVANGTYIWTVVPSSYIGLVNATTLTFTPTGGSANISRFSVQAVSFLGASNADVKENIAIGQGALYMCARGAPFTAMDNIAIGLGAGRQHTTGNDCIYIGVEAGLSNGPGDKNTIIGRRAGYSNNNGTGNVALGYYAGYYEMGSNSFYLNNQDRINTAGDKSLSLIYGTFAATAAAQTLAFNAQVTLLGGASLLSTATNLTDGSAAQVGTLTNAPVAGNPTKWITINDNGTPRKIPSW